MRNNPFLVVASIAALVGLLALSPRASAQRPQQFWDGSTTTFGPGSPHGGSGNWDNTTTNWTTLAVEFSSDNAYSNFVDVIFSGATGTVTLTSNITTNHNSVTFSTDGYVINANGSSVLETFSGFTVDPGVTATINAPITNSLDTGADLTKNGTGTLILSGINTYTGITAINAGVLSISQDANLGTPPGGPVADQLTFNGGTLQATASFTLNANRGITLLAGGGTIGVTGANVLTYGGVITGAGSLTKSDAGTLILSGINTYTGFTAINAGVLSISQDANLGTPPGGPVADQLTFNGGTLQATASFTLNANRGITLLAGGGTIGVTGANVLTYGGVITGAGSLTKSDAGTLILSGINTYTGFTAINAGVLSISQDANLGTPPGGPVADQLTFNGGTLQATASFTLNANRGITLLAGGGTIGVTGANVLTYGGVITGAGSLTKSDAGTLTLTGANTYSGGTNLNGGTLAANSDANLGAGALSFNGGTLEALAAGGGIISSKAITLNAGGGTFLADPGTASTLSGAITGVGAWTKAGMGTLTLTGANTYTGGTTINAGTLQLGNGGTTGSIAGNVTDNGILAFDRSNVLTFGGVISGTGSVQQNGTGTTVLVVDNTYAGGTTINAGTLQLGNGGTTGSITGNVTDNGILAFDRSNILTFGGVISGTGSVQQNGTGTTVLVVDNTYTGGTTINAGTLQLGNGGTTGSITGNVTDNGILAFDRSNILTFGGVISGTGSVQQNGTGTTVLVVDNTYTGGTTINTGALQLGNGGTTGSITGNVTDNGVLAFDRSNVLTFGGVISGSGSVQQNGTGTTVLVVDNTYAGGTTINAGTLQLGNGGTTGSIIGDVTDNRILAFDRSNVLTFGGVISGSGSVQQNGTGTTVLVVDNTYAGGTTINAGTLQLGNGGMTGSITGNVLDNGILAFDRSNVLTFGGVISGTGSVQQNGTGTTVLVGDNTYAGGTTINAGTLQLGNGGMTGSITGNVTDNGILAFDRSNILTFGGVISGTGSVQQNGTGTTVLVVDNTYTGGTTINTGALQLGNGGTTGSITGNVTDNGVLAFDRSNVLTFRGVISGSGSVQQNGTGTTVLVRDNTYAGGTTINAGTLQLGNGGTTGSITGNVTDNGILAFDRSNVLTFGGVISGTGSLQQNGTGTTVLVRDNTYTGATTVNAGNLIVDGSIASAQTLVNAGGFLGGHGIIGGNLVNGGVVGQVNSPGTLTVLGNYMQTSGGTLRIGVAGPASGQHDMLASNGHVTLGGTFQIVSLGGFTLQPGEQITFITAKNGVSGSFANVQNGIATTGTIVQATVTSLTNSVVLETSQGSFATTPGVATTPNTSAVAKALDSAAGDPREAALFAFLNSQPLANLPNDLNLISPQQLGSFHATGTAQGNTQIASLSGRMANIQAGSTGFSSAGFAINGGAASFGEGFAGVSGPEGKSGPAVFAPAPENRWGVFVTGIGEFTNVGNTPNATGYDVNTGGFTTGVDYRVTPFLAVGLTAGYAHSIVNLNAGGDIDVNSGKFGVYATAFSQGFYLDTAISGGPSGYNSHRTALQGTASGSTNGAGFDFLVAAGYDWKYGGLTIGPIASFQLGYIGISAFSESGSLAPLKFPDQNFESERTGFGGRVSYDWKIGHVTVIPEFRATWVHEYGDTAFSIVAGFASGAGNNFTVTSAETGRDSLAIGAGVSVIWNERVSTYVYYDGEVARTNYQYNAVTGGVRIAF